MTTIEEIRKCNTAFKFWTNNCLSREIERTFGENVLERKVESKNKIWFVIKAGETNHMMAYYCKRFKMYFKIEIIR